MLTVLRRVFDFSSWYATHPSEPPPGDMLDASFDAQNQKISEIEALVEQIRRSDGQLQNAIVTRDSLHPEVYGDLRYEMRFAAAQEALKSEELTKRAEKAAKSAENSVLNAIEAEAGARASETALSNARNSQISRLEAVIAESRAILAELSAKSAELLEVESHAGHSEAWAITSAQWAEHMPDTLPESALVSMDVTGDQHWSSKWWASKAAAAFGQLSELYLGAHPTPPITTETGDPIPLGGIYYNTETGQMYVWDGSQWVSMTQPQRAGLAALWYSATEGQTVFPFSVMDLNGRNYMLSIDATEGVDAHVNGVKVMPAEVSEGDWTLDSATSTVTFLRPLRLGDIVSFDILMANEKLGPGAVNSWSLSLSEAKDGTRVSFTLLMEDGSGPTVTVSRNEELLVSLDGVVQEPGVSYTSSGSTITFSQAPAADSWVFITWFRSEGGTGVMAPTSGTDWADITGKPATFPPTLPIAQSGVTNLVTDLGNKLNVSAYTASDVLAKLLTVDGAASNLDADMLDAQSGAYYLDLTNATGSLAAARFNDTSHGTRGGGNLHPAVTTTVNGFMIAADKVKLNAVPTITVGNVAPGSPVVNDVWIDTT